MITSKESVEGWEAKLLRAIAKYEAADPLVKNSKLRYNTKTNLWRYSYNYINSHTGAMIIEENPLVLLNKITISTRQANEER